MNEDVRRELKGARIALWVLVVGAVFGSFAHAGFLLGVGHQRLGDSWMFAMPGGAFSVVGALVLLYFVAAVERTTSTIAQQHGKLASLVALGVLGCILGVRVLTDLVLLLRARRHVADTIALGGAGVPGDRAAADALRKRVGVLIAVRAAVQIVGVVPALVFAHDFKEGTQTAAAWAAVSIAPFASLVLVVLVAWRLTHALVDAFGRPALGALSAGVSVAVPTTRES